MLSSPTEFDAEVRLCSLPKVLWPDSCSSMICGSALLLPNCLAPLCVCVCVYLTPRQSPVITGSTALLGY